MAQVTFSGVYDGMAVVHLITDSYDGETRIPLHKGETAEQAAARWAMEAYGVALLPAPPSPADVIADLQRRVAALETNPVV